MKPSFRTILPEAAFSLKALLIMSNSGEQENLSGGKACNSWYKKISNKRGLSCIMEDPGKGVGGFRKGLRDEGA